MTNEATAKRLPWMKWYSRDALGDPALRLCTPEARGVWYDMLWLMDVAERRGYLTRNGHPYEDGDLCRILALTQDELTRAKIELTRAGVPSVEDGTGIWFNRRMVRDERLRESGRVSGKRGGGNPRLQNTDDRDQKPDTRSQIPEARTPIKETFIGTAKGLPIGFDEFWKAYPRKVGKQRALKAWKTTSKIRPELAVILESLETHKRSSQWTKDDGQFIPHPATWLRDGRWDDEALEKLFAGGAPNDITEITPELMEVGL